MSDPVSNAEIEDVLSSIRRLVAGGKPDDTRLADASSEEHSNEAAPEPSRPEEALVLTPSLRVEEPDTMDAANIAEIPEAERWEDDGVLDREFLDSERSDPVKVTELEGAPDEELAFSKVPPEKTEGIEEDTLGLPTFIRPLEASTKPVTSPEKDPSEAQSLKDLEAEESNGAAEDLPHTRATRRAGFMFSPLSEQEAEAPSDQEAAETEAPFFDGADESDVASIPNEAPIAEPIRFSVPKVEPEVVSAASNGDEAVLDAEESDITGSDPWSADFEGSGAAFSEAIEDDRTEASENLFASGAAAVDEDALREMVTEMLHQELRGALGERITRNVRKLVRREIHRALASRDFD